MINRHPHTLILKYKKNSIVPEDATADSSETTGIEGSVEEDLCEEKLQGRMQFSRGNHSKYVAKFFTGKTNLKLFEDDSLTATFEERQFGILQVIPLQTHTEIWLT